jgi:hypothetical protein
MAHNSTNINIRYRLTQVIILVLLVLAAILFSQVANAGPKPKFDKHKYRTEVHKNSHRSCYVLYKKRTSGGKQSLFAFLKHSKGNNRNLAETDGPVTASN